MSRHFTSKVIDDDPDLLRESYRLRYKVYCLERGFLPAEDYPDGLEIDVYDSHSVHIGVLNMQGELVATARLVERSAAGLPLLSYCTLFPTAPSLNHVNHRVIEVSRLVVEVSRLAVSRKYNRRAGDGFFALQGGVDRKNGHRREGGEIVLTLYKALYQASKRRGFTHWIAATEKSLQRLVAKYGFPFKAIGPETDYCGPISPYLMELAEFDNLILSGRIPLLSGFLQGLEPQFGPGEDDAVLALHHRNECA